jgi:hypothetical protein
MLDKTCQANVLQGGGVRRDVILEGKKASNQDVLLTAWKDANCAVLR